MASGTSLPSDFVPVPQVMLPHAREAFVTRSLTLAGVLQSGPGGGGAVELMNDPGFQAGGQYLEGPTILNSVAANRRDITSTSALTAQKVTAVNNRGVIINRRSDLMAFTDDTGIAGWNKDQISAELGIAIGEKAADDMWTAIISALMGAVAAVGSSAHVASLWSATVRTNLSPDVIDQGRILMGDRMDALRYMLVRSESDRDLRADAVGRSYDSVGGRALGGDNNANGYGLRKAIRDDATLTAADAGFDKYYTLLLGAGAIKVWFVRPLEIETIRVISNEIKTTQLRGDWDLGLQIPSMYYDDTGGANPANSTLATAASWTDQNTSAKSCPIVQILHNYSGN